MFGYVKPFCPELRVKEYDAYKAVYCGLCGQLGKSFGPVARLTLSYDFTFVSMLYWAVNPEVPVVERRRCYVNPLKKQPTCLGGEGLARGADLAAIMIYHKLVDNILDERLPAKLGWTLLRPLAASANRKAAAARPEAAELIAGQMVAQRRIEEENVDSVDAACEPTAVILGGIFRELSKEATQRRVLERLGYLLGRFVYLCDALDDMERDARTGGYNPVLLRYKLAPDKGDWVHARQMVTESLLMTIGEAEKTLALLDMHDFIPIINNIVSMGLRGSVEEILAKKEKADDRPV